MNEQCSNQVSELRPGVSSFHQTTTSAVEHGPATTSRPNGVRKTALAAALGVSLLFALGSSATAEVPPPLNGSQPRPFYVIGHNPNTIEDVMDALKGGANALEPDVAVTNCNGQDILIDFDTDLGIPSHCGELQFVDWCDAVNTIAQTNKNLAMVLIDIKEEASATPTGAKIMDIVRNHLNTNGVNLNIIYSTPKTNYGTVFELMYSKLNEREGVQFDGNDSPWVAVDYFFNHGYANNIGYGDGTSIQYGPLARIMDRAVFLRAAIGYPRVVSDVFLIDLADSMRHFINSGVDGMIVKAGNESQATNIIAQEHPEIRLATRDDNPFQPLNEAYGIQVYTDGDGTDADIKFTLHGCKGSATITVNSGLFVDAFPVIYDTHRFKSGNEDWVTIPSKDLGELQSITIENKGGGLYPKWHVEDIRVKSFRYIGAGEYTNTVGAIIPDGTTTNLTLTPTFTLPPPTIQCPADQVLANNPGQCGAVLNFAPQVDGPCNDVTAVCDPPSGTLFPVGTTTVTCYATNTSGGGSAPCTFTVTVQDTEPPVIACPGSMVVNATSPAGAVVQFPLTATDNCGATIASTPASGSVLPIGDTLVQSTATDPSANQVSCSFNVHVKGALEQTQDLLAAVNALNTKPGVKNGLLFQLNTALAGLQYNNPVVACGALKSFIDLVSAQRGKTISTSDADSLIAAATQIRAVIGCNP
jgi:Glycerophosphoryl diester phosphodiesterase